MKGREKIPVVTCYDYSMARLCEAAEIPVLLVGDSLGNVILGYETTVPVRLKEMIHHARAVVRGRSRALVVADMPFLTFQAGASRAVRLGGRLLQESGADAVKIEGAGDNLKALRRMVEAGIPVMGHLGLTPQSVLEFGGYPVRGRGAAGEQLLEDARRIEAAGAFALVLEKIPAPLAARVTAALSIPTIGIGAGSGCDGQVLVLYDLLGLNPDFQPRFVKRFADLGTTIRAALEQYRDEVRRGEFPGVEHSYTDEASAAAPNPPAQIRDPGQP